MLNVTSKQHKRSAILSHSSIADYSHRRKVGILVVLDLQLVAKVAKNSVLKILNVIF